MKSNILKLSIFASVALLQSPLHAEEFELDPIVVNSDFREAKLSRTTGSVMLLNEEDLYDKASNSFIETLSSVPNVNFTSGASKAKYIQIRGIGERSQFKAPMNPSVGLIVDGIDLSNATLGVGMFDVKQVEVLRGPQGVTFGANALAGIINVQSNEPTKETQGHAEISYGNYNTKAVGVAVGGTLAEDVLLGRISIYKNSSDGFIDNSFLHRDDTQNIDEIALKVGLKWLVSDKQTIDINLLHADVDNGYDAFNFSNTRTTQSDKPGQDKQKTDALSLKSTYDFETMKLISRASYSKSKMTYSYDEDWSYDGAFDASLYPYSSFDQYKRDKKQFDLDVRLVSDEGGAIFDGSTSWILGAYYKDYKEDLVRNYTYLTAPYISKYDTTNKALYGQLDTVLSDKLTLIGGLRVEKWDAGYTDSDSFSVDTDEVLIGGKLGLKYQMDENQLYYATLSRGYKPGGVNPDNTLGASAREFKTETLWNIDLGVNGAYMDNALTSRFNFFYGKRKDQQVKSSVVSIRTDGSTDFTDYLANAAEGYYYGIESQLDYRVNDALDIFANVGLLRAKFDEYIDPNPSALSMNGRAPAQSPKYQYNLGLNYMIDASWNFKTALEGKGSYFFSNRHNAKSKAYTLLNASLEYTNENYTFALWGRNLTDKKYQTRGFGSFGNNPGNGYATELYTQQGDPRTVGFTVSYDF